MSHSRKRSFLCCSQRHFRLGRLKLEQQFGTNKKLQCQSFSLYLFSYVNIFPSPKLLLPVSQAMLLLLLFNLQRFERKHQDKKQASADWYRENLFSRNTKSWCVTIKPRHQCHQPEPPLCSGSESQQSHVFPVLFLTPNTVSPSHYTQLTEWIQSSTETRCIVSRVMSESSLPSPGERSLSSSALSSSIALLDQRTHTDTVREWGWENLLTAHSQIPDVAHMGAWDRPCPTAPG